MKVVRYLRFSDRTFLDIHLTVGNLLRIYYFGCGGWLYRCRDDTLPSKFEDCQQ